MAIVIGDPFNDILNGTGVSDVIKAFAGNDLLKGFAANDFLYGGSGSDRLYGAAGNDLLNGGSGADKMFGGTGNDTYFVDNLLDTVTEAVNAGTDTIRSSITLSLTVGGRVNVENLTLSGLAPLSGIGNALNNVITGNNASNTLRGLGGHDWLLGKGGNDFLFGGAGIDRLDGGAGADIMRGGADHDVYVVDNLRDIVIEALGEGIDSIYSSISLSLSATSRLNVENLFLTGSTALSAVGNTLNNSLSGNGLANTLTGLAGNYSQFG
jgi:Ca2+-binding RTX toxin-like protein